jgi:hypothetical protein
MRRLKRDTRIYAGSVESALSGCVAGWHSRASKSVGICEISRAGVCVMRMSTDLDIRGVVDDVLSMRCTIYLTLLPTSN